jgi:hypothetical protein
VTNWLSPGYEDKWKILCTKYRGVMGKFLRYSKPSYLKMGSIQKKSSIRDHLPWVNQYVKRLIRKRNWAFKKVNKSGSSSNRKKFLDMKHLVQKKVKEAYNQYLEDILNLSNIDAQNGHKPNTKKLYSLIKHSKQEKSDSC